MLKLSWNTPLVSYCAAALHASSFDLLCFCFLKCAVSFCCCGVFSFDLCFCVLPCVMCFISFCGGGFFRVSAIYWHLFFRARAFQIPNRVLLFLFILGMDVLPKHGDQESSHDISVVASHVDHVVGLGVFDVSQLLLVRMWSICFSFPFGETKDVCFLGVFLNIVLRAK